MIISANQPYFFPFPGFFYKANLSDIIVILDCVQFPWGTTWITRNRFKNNQGSLWMTVPVKKKGMGLQNINCVSICHDDRWTKKHLYSLKNAYLRAPYYMEHISFLDDLFSSRFERLIDLNLEIMHYMMRHLRIETKVLLLSDLGINAKGDRLLIEICKKVGASQFLVQSAANKYLDVNMFRETGVLLIDFRLPSLIYPQLWGDFIPNLSALDLIFNCGPKAHDILISQA